MGRTTTMPLVASWNVVSQELHYSDIGGWCNGRTIASNIYIGAPPHKVCDPSVL